MRILAITCTCDIQDTHYMVPTVRLPTARRAARRPRAAMGRPANRPSIRVWDPRARTIDAPGVVVPEVPAPTLASARRLAALELELHARVKRARSDLTSIARASTSGTSSSSSSSPLLLFERWLARCALAATRDDDGALAAPLLPGREDGLAKDLRRHGADEEAASRGAKDATMRSRTAAARWAAASSSAKFGDDESFSIVVRDAGGFVSLQLGEKKPYVKVTKTHLGKLRALYCRTCRRGKPLSEDVNSSEYVTFAYCVFALLLRYESLGGAGYQAALGEDAFDVLRASLAVSCECFASPLNARYGSFCSAFFDVDAYFGSLGNFFGDGFAPRCGSFEMNPPFVPETMLAAVEKASALLDVAEKSGDALSFVVVVPAWKECKFWAFLHACSHLKSGPDIVEAASHGFCDGAQHARPMSERHRVSSFDTGVWYLQSTEASKKWSCTREVRDDVTRAMKNALGSCKTIADLERRYRGKRTRDDVAVRPDPHRRRPTVDALEPRHRRDRAPAS